MFGIGTMEIFVILLVGVMVLGPEHLPKLVRTLTKAMSDMRRVSTDFQRAINLEANREEWEQKQAEAAPKKKKKKKPAPQPEAPPPATPATSATVNTVTKTPAAPATDPDPAAHEDKT